MLKPVQIVQGLAALQVDRPSEILIRGANFFPKVVAERYLEKTKDSPANISRVEVGNSAALRNRFALLIKCLVKHLI